MRDKGFTLLELIIVIVIVAVLATVAIPQYMQAAERSQGAKAKHAIKVIISAEKLYFAEKGQYATFSSYDLPDICTSGICDYVELDELNRDKDWWYEVRSQGEGVPFWIFASRKRGANSARSICIDSNGAACSQGSDKWPPPPQVVMR